MKTNIAIYIVLTLMLFNCNQNINQNVDRSSCKDSSKEFIPKRMNFSNLISTEIKGDSEVDTVYFNLDGQKMMMLPEGKVYNSNDSLVLDLKIEDYIEQIYFFRIESDIIAIFVESDGDSGWSTAKRISLKSNKIIWSTNIWGFNMERPVIIDNMAYVSTLGFVGKLNITDGKYFWKHENLYDEGKYNNFEEPKFFQNNLVLFLSKDFRTKKYDSILIDDNSGKIIRMN
jgi:hypothetical protein